MDENFSKTPHRRDIIRHAGLLGVIGFSGFEGLKSVSTPAIAAPDGTPEITEGIRTGIHPVSPYDIEYQNLDTTSPITITYIFTDSTGFETTETHSVSLSEKSASGTVNTGAHDVRVPPGNVQLGIEVAHPSLSNTLLSTPSSEYTVLPNVGLVDDGTILLNSFSGEIKAGKNSISSYEIKYDGLKSSTSLTITYLFTDSSDKKFKDTHTVALSDGTKSDTISTGSHDISVPSGTLDLDIEFSHPSLGEKIKAPVGSLGEVLATVSVVDDGATASNVFNGKKFAGSHTIPSYDIDYDGLDTSNIISIEYVFTDSSGIESTDTHTVSLSGKKESDTISTGVHSLSVPSGTLDLIIEVSHDSLESTHVTNVGSVGEVFPDIVDASGGTTVIDRTIGGQDYRIHAFENVGNDTFTVNSTPPAATVDVLVVAGGGGSMGDVSGGGGAGGLVYKSNVSVSSSNYSVFVGAGGNGAPVGNSYSANATSGQNSSIDISDVETAIGGGHGANYRGPNAANGGSGGGDSRDTNSGNGTTGQGNKGGDLSGYTGHESSGGGGAGQTGEGGSGDARDGGDGLYFGDKFTDGFGENGYFAGGGGGGSGGRNPETGGSGGLGGGGNGKDRQTPNPGNDGMPNTGGGGGGNAHPHYGGADGGSGVVLIRYKT